MTGPLGSLDRPTLNLPEVRIAFSAKLTYLTSVLLTEASGHAGTRYDRYLDQGAGGFA